MAKRKFEECLSCSLCLDIFSEPKTLPCLHRFCKTCLDKYITSSTRQSTGNIPSFSCPFCRENTVAPNPKLPRSEWASQFKTDFLIKDIIRGSEEQPEMKNACPTHTDIEYDCYCFDCSAILCHKCAINSHRQCGHVEMLTDAVRDRKAAVNDAIQNMRTLIEESTKWERFCNTQKDAIDRDSNKIAGDIQTWGKELRERITQEETKLLAQLAEKRKGLTDKVNSAVEDIQNMKKQFQGRLDTAESKLSLLNIEVIMMDKSVLDITRECQKVNPTKAVEDMKRICSNISNVTFSFQQYFSRCSRSIEESRNVNSTVTSDELSQVSNRRRAESSSLGIDFRRFMSDI